jgi:hypothetical protein
MPIRPTMGGVQAPQWLLETIRNIEQNIRRLEESINSLKRGEPLAPTPALKDTTSGDNSGGSGGNSSSWNGNLGISVNNMPVSTNARFLNFKSGTGLSITKKNYLSGQVDLTFTNTGATSGVKVSKDTATVVTGATNLNFEVDSSLILNVTDGGSGMATISMAQTYPNTLYDYAGAINQPFDTSYTAFSAMPFGVQTDNMYWYELQLSVYCVDSNWNFDAYIDCDESDAFRGATYSWGGHTPQSQSTNGSAGAVNVNSLPASQYCIVTVKGLVYASTDGLVNFYFKSTHDAVINCGTVLVKKLTII